MSTRPSAEDRWTQTRTPEASIAIITIDRIAMIIINRIASITSNRIAVITNDNNSSTEPNWTRRDATREDETSAQRWHQLSGGLRCAIVGVQWRRSVSACLAWGDFVCQTHVLNKC